MNKFIKKKVMFMFVFVGKREWISRTLVQLEPFWAPILSLDRWGRSHGRRKRTGIELAPDLDPNPELVELGRQTLGTVKLRESLKLECRHWHAGFS